MSATTDRGIALLIAYLERQLCTEGRKYWNKISPRCFLYKDRIDTVFVKVTDRNLIIITDGNNVIDEEQSLPIHCIGDSSLEDIFNQAYLQPILAVF